MDDSTWGNSSSTDADTSASDVDTSSPAPEQVAPENTGTPVPVAGPEDVLTESKSDEDVFVPPTPGETVTSPVSDEPQPDGVQAGGLTYTQNADGTRDYADQEPVETTGDPTPTPEA